MLSVHVHSRANELDPAAWDALGGDPLSQHAVLRVVEEAGLPGVEMAYATVADEAGRLVAAAPFSSVAIDGARLTHGVFRGLIRAARTVRPRFLRTRLMVCGTPLSVASPPVRMAEGVDAAAVFRVLAHALECHGERAGAAWCVFKELAAAELPPAQAALDGAGGWLFAPSEPNSLLSIAWDDWDAYLGALRSDYRYKIRKALRAFAAAGGEVDTVTLADGYNEELHGLYEAVLARAPIQFERLTPQFFLTLGHALGNRARLIRFHQGGRVIGWVAVLLAGDRVYDLFHGIDYAANARCALYFNQLAAVIRCAIEHGARSLSLGQSTEVAKGRFGAREVPLWIALRHRSRTVTRGLLAGRQVLFPGKRIPRHHVFRAG